MKSKHFTKLLTNYPNEVLDVALDILHLPNDAALARELGFLPPTISKFRHHVLPIGATVIVRLLEAADIHVSELHELTMNKHRARLPSVTAAKNDHVGR